MYKSNNFNLLKNNLCPSVGSYLPTPLFPVSLDMGCLSRGENPFALASRCVQVSQHWGLEAVTYAHVREKGNEFSVFKWEHGLY